MTVFEFAGSQMGMTVSVNYDTGWNENLGTSGRSVWTTTVAINENDAAIFRIRSGLRY
jgi:hypothetical protein